MSDNTDRAIAGGTTALIGLGLVGLGVGVIPGMAGLFTSGSGALLLLTGAAASADAGTPDAPFWPERKTPRTPIPPILGYATPAPPPQPKEEKPEPTYGRRRDLFNELERKTPRDDGPAPQTAPANSAQEQPAPRESSDAQTAAPALEPAETVFLHWFASTVEYTGAETDELPLVGLAGNYISYCTANRKQAIGSDVLVSSITYLATQLGCRISKEGIVGARLRT